MKEDFNLISVDFEIVFKLLTQKDENEVDSELVARKKLNKHQSTELTTRMKKMILSVDGNSDRTFINNFIDNEFLSIDSLAFRQYLAEITPDVDMNTTVVNSAGEEIEVTIPVTLRFFWPSAGI